MNDGKLFEKYYTRLKKEGWIKAIICAFILGFAINFLTAFIAWMVNSSIFWLSIVLGVAAIAAFTPIFYYKKFRPTAKDIARRIDRLGLEERIITMTELERDESYIALKQREDAEKKLDSVEAKQLRFRFSAVALSVAIICTILGISMTTVTTLSAQGALPGGRDFIGLEVEGNGSGTNFQMKQAGLYHKSQIIKQPDVMLLFSYLDVTIDGADYSANWDYYEKMCESSSSLTFPVHAICSARAGRPLSFLNYLEDCAEIDIRDLHRCAHQGVHSGCLAGAWYAVFRGVFGITVNSEGIFVSPKPQPFWNKTSLNFVYKGIRISAELTKTEFVLRSEKKNDIPIYFDGKRFSLGGKLKLSLLS